MKIIVVTNGTTATIVRLSAGMDFPRIGEVLTLRMISFPNARKETFLNGYPTMILPEIDKDENTYFFGLDELNHSADLVPTFVANDAWQVVKCHEGPDVILTSVVMNTLFNHSEHRQVKMYYVIHLVSAQVPIAYKSE
jgi:hypothetical protein